MADSCFDKEGISYLSEVLVRRCDDGRAKKGNEYSPSKFLMLPEWLHGVFDLCIVTSSDNKTLLYVL